MITQIPDRHFVHVLNVSRVRRERRTQGSSGAPADAMFPSMSQGDPASVLWQLAPSRPAPPPIAPCLRLGRLPELRRSRLSYECQAMSASTDTALLSGGAGEGNRALMTSLEGCSPHPC